MGNMRDTVRMPDDSKLEKAGYHMALSVAHKMDTIGTSPASGPLF